MDASLRLEHSLLAIEQDHRLHVMLELKAPESPEQAARPPLSLALVLDRSGSMAGRKLATAASCAAWLADRLGSRHRLALVVFDHEVLVAQPLVPGSGEHVRQALRWIGARGATNLSGGWLKGVELLREADGDGPRALMLLTDGAANQGIVDLGQLVEMARWAAEQGVTTTTIGYGEGFNEALLQRMADAGGGRAHYAEGPEDAPAVFAEEAEDLSALVAQNVSAEIRPAEPVRLVELLSDLPLAPTAKGARVELGDAHAGQRRRVVFALEVPSLGKLGPRALGELVVRYTTVGGDPAAHKLTFPITANLAASSEAARQRPDREVREEIEILRAARDQREAAEDADRGDFGAATRRLKVAANRLRELGAGSGRIEELLAHARDLEEASHLTSPERWGAASAKNLRYDSHRRTHGRTPQQRREPRPPTNEDEERRSA